jgi:uncharacterized membrane protein
MPPIHPAFVHFPIALVTLAVIADLAGHWRNSGSWRATALGSLFGAAIGAVVPVAAGYYDMGRATLAETHEYVHLHMTGWVLLGFVIGLTLWRWRISRRTQPRIGVAYFLAAFLALGITFFQGWYGGELVYSQSAGVAAAGKGTEPPSAGYERPTGVSKRLGAEVGNHREHEETTGEAHE